MYSIQEVAKAAGTTSRTLRHYDDVGILKPSRIGANGYRYYDDRALVRLQRILLLRDLGLGLDAIGTVLDAQDRQALGQAQDRQPPGQAQPGGTHRPDAHPSAAEARILRSHLDLLLSEQRRITAQIGAVERTVAALERGDTGGIAQETRGDLMSQNMFDGFDHTQYREEVEQRWGADAYRRSDDWWRGLGADGQAEWRARVQQLQSDWIAAFERGEDPQGDAAQDLAARHVEWLRGIPVGTPIRKETHRVSASEFLRPLPQASTPGGDVVAYVSGLAEMYVADERFAANYGGIEGASFVRDALLAHLRSGAVG